MGKGYILYIAEYDSNWEPRIRELGRGSIYEQGVRLFEGWQKKVGPRTIKLWLEDASGFLEDLVYEC